MERLLSLLESPSFRLVLIVLGASSAIVTILAAVFQGPSLVVAVALGGLVVTAVIGGLIILQYLGMGREGDSNYRYMARRYGLGQEYLDTTCTVHKDGSALVKRAVKIKAYSLITSLETSLIIPEPAPNKDDKRKIGFIDARSVTRGRDIAAKTTIDEGRRRIVTIALSPELKAGKTTEYEMSEMLPPGLYAIDLSADALKQRQTPYEYFGWNIDRPTRHLSLKVYFPDGCKRPEDYGSEVRYARIQHPPLKDDVQREEQKRIDDPKLASLDDGRYMLSMEVTFPMVGLIYILKWGPLATKQETIDTAAENITQSQPLTRERHMVVSAASGVSTVVAQRDPSPRTIASPKQSQTDTSPNPVPSSRQHQSNARMTPKVKLRQILESRFSESELDTLCFDLGVNYTDLPGRNRPDKARELIKYMERHGGLADLVTMGKRHRPSDVAWDDLGF